MAQSRSTQPDRPSPFAGSSEPSIPDATLRRFSGFVEARDTGRSLRKRCPRSSLARWEVVPDRTSALDLILSQERGRLQALIPERHRRMAASPFAYFRATALPMAADLSTTPSTGLIVEACGDAHIGNFGGYRSPESALVFDLNDFDEVARGPWEWDVKRMVSSVAVCACSRGFGAATAHDAALACAAAYREAMAYFAHQGALSIWHTHVDVQGLLDALSADASKKERRQVAKGLAAAFAKDNSRAFRKLVEGEGADRRIVFDPPAIVPLDRFLPAGDVERFPRSLAELFSAYRSSLAPENRGLIDRYAYVGAALKVVGVGSVGMRNWVVALSGRQVDDPLVLQFKEAGESCLSRYTGLAPRYRGGERVVRGQRLMQATGDVLLGWADVPVPGAPGRSFYVRQLWDWKATVDLDAIDADTLALYGELCAWTLARAHARSGDRGAIAGYLGTSDAADRALCAFAEAYAEQNECDYRVFMDHVAGAAGTGKGEAS